MAEPVPTTLRPRLWYLALAGGSVAIGILVVNLVLGGSPVIAPFGGIGGALGMRYTFRIQVDDTGLSMQRRSIRWDEAELRTGRWGETLHNPQAERSRRMQAFLPTYEQDWREGTIGAFARRHAPQLLDQSKPA